MTPHRYRDTIRGKLTIAFISAVMLVFPPVIASLVHFHRLYKANSDLQLIEAHQQAAPEAQRKYFEQQIKDLRSHAIKITDQAYRDVLSLTSVSVVVIVILTTTMPRKVLRPLRRLINIVKQVEGGRLNVAQIQITPDEIGDLAERLDRILRDLRDFDRLKSAKIASLAEQRNELLDFLETPAIILDHELRIQRLSHLFCLTFGVRGEELVDKIFTKALGWENRGLAPLLGESRAYEQLNLPIPGGEHTFSVSSKHISGTPDRPGYIIVLFA